MSLYEDRGNPDSVRHLQSVVRDIINTSATNLRYCLDTLAPITTVDPGNAHTNVLAPRYLFAHKYNILASRKLTPILANSNFNDF